MANKILHQQNNDELLDLVDHNDNVIGVMPRAQVYALGLNNFRVINAFLVNGKGQFWIPKRTATKTLFPNCLDVSVGGHVESGESYLQAFARELQEELNLNLSEVSYRFITQRTPHQNNVSAFMHFYIIDYENEPNYNKADFSSSIWIEPDKLLKLLESGEPAKGDLIKLVQYYLQNCVNQ